MTHRYIARAKRLRLQAPYKDLPHYQFLSEVARTYKAPYWAALMARRSLPTRAWQGIAKLWQRKLKPSRNLDQLLYSHVQDFGLNLGVDIRSKSDYVLPDGDVRTHILVAGRGRTVFIEHLLAQQAVRGGGFLYVDNIHEDLRKLDTVANAVGRRVFHEQLFDPSKSHENLLARAVEYQEMSRWPVALFLEEERSKFIAKVLMQYLQNLIQAQLEKLKSPGTPFLVVLPLDLLHLHPQLPTLFSRARAAGIAFVLVAHYASTPQLEVAWDNTATHVCLQAQGTQARYLAGRGQGAMGGELSQLPLGEARVYRGGTTTPLLLTWMDV